MQQRISRPHLLAADEDPALRALYHDLFTDVGFRVTLARPPLTLQEIRVTQPDLLLLDWPYPWQEPPALLHDVRQTVDLDTLPILVTTTAPKNVPAPLAPHPCVQLLNKPFEMGAILTLTDLLLMHARELTRESRAIRQELAVALEEQYAALRRSGPGGGTA